MGMETDDGEREKSWWGIQSDIGDAQSSDQNGHGEAVTGGEAA